MNYRRKKAYVKALQFSLITPVDNAVKIFGYNPVCSENGNYYVLCSESHGIKATRKTSDLIPVYEGDYVVEENGILSVLSEREFAEHYEQIKDVTSNITVTINIADKIDVARLIKELSGKIESKIQEL
ncbi:hypothetical protein ACTHO0_23100 [Cytobacillus praedii]|uniref:hypothetical protein n=1 Tax=Cytobacillus praedii TaxID=1742358 RepID=UPI003F7FB97C